VQVYRVGAKKYLGIPPHGAAETMHCGWNIPMMAYWKIYSTKNIYRINIDWRHQTF
jgi:hypothetical protein